VSSALYGAEKLFHRLGYISDRGDVLTMDMGNHFDKNQGQHSQHGQHEESPDQDKAITVARDCLLASVECQVRMNG